MPYVNDSNPEWTRWHASERCAGDPEAVVEVDREEIGEGCEPCRICAVNPLRAAREGD